MYSEVESLPLFHLVMLLNNCETLEKTVQLVFCKKGNWDTCIIVFKAFSESNVL